MEQPRRAGWQKDVAPPNADARPGGLPPGTKERAEKHPDNAEVNELIGLMREVAIRLMKLVRLGDAYEAVRLENRALRARVASMEEEWALAAHHEEQFEDWQELLLNFRSGVVDQGELLEGTVGRS